MLCPAALFNVVSPTGDICNDILFGIVEWSKSAWPTNALLASNSYVPIAIFPISRVSGNIAFIVNVSASFDNVIFVPAVIVLISAAILPNMPVFLTISLAVI